MFVSQRNNNHYYYSCFWIFQKMHKKKIKRNGLLRVYNPIRRWEDLITNVTANIINDKISKLYVLFFISTNDQINLIAIHICARTILQHSHKFDGFSGRQRHRVPIKIDMLKEKKIKKINKTRIIEKTTQANAIQWHTHINVYGHWFLFALIANTHTDSIVSSTECKSLS